MKYEHGVFLWPYAGDGQEGFGTGTGVVKGLRLRGTMVWANQPHRRQDGVWCPNLRGSIRSEDRADVLVRVRGFSINELEKKRRAIVAPVWFHVADER